MDIGKAFAVGILILTGLVIFGFTGTNLFIKGIIRKLVTGFFLLVTTLFVGLGIMVILAPERLVSNIGSVFFILVIVMVILIFPICEMSQEE